MAAVVSLRAVVDEIEFQLNETRGFLNKQTGELYSGTNEDVDRAEHVDDEELEEKMAAWLETRGIEYGP